MAEPLYRVELTASFLARLEAIDAFLRAAETASGVDVLLAGLRVTVIPNLSRFPRLGRCWLDNPPQSVEALARLTDLPSGAMEAWREYLHGDDLILYTVDEAKATVYLLSIRHHRELSFDFARLWPGGDPGRGR